MNASILKDCPVCHNFEPEPEESIERSSDGRIWSGRYRRWIPTNSAGEHGFAFRVEIDVVRNQASNSCNGCMLLYQGILQCLASKPKSLVDEDQLCITVESAPGRAIKCCVWVPSVLDVPIFWNFEIFAVSGMTVKIVDSLCGLLYALTLITLRQSNPLDKGGKNNVLSQICSHS